MTTHGGRRSAQLDLVEWVAHGQQLGAGEVVVNSMDADGTQDGFDIQMLAAVRKAVTVPVVASGGTATLDQAITKKFAKKELLLAKNLAVVKAAYDLGVEWAAKNTYELTVAAA